MVSSIEFDEKKVLIALQSAWSLDTAVQWTAENPALGQCNVTAAVIHDLFGGEILRTRLDDVWHYYNRIGSERMDLTAGQFDGPGALFNAPERYEDAPSSRADAMQGIPQREYDALRNALVRNLSVGAQD